MPKMIVWKMHCLSNMLCWVSFSIMYIFPRQEKCGKNMEKNEETAPGSAEVIGKPYNISVSQTAHDGAKTRAM